MQWISSFLEGVKSNKQQKLVATTKKKKQSSKNSDVEEQQQQQTSLNNIEEGMTVAQSEYYNTDEKPGGFEDSIDDSNSHGNRSGHDFKSHEEEKRQNFEKSSMVVQLDSLEVQQEKTRIRAHENDICKEKHMRELFQRICQLHQNMPETQTTLEQLENEILSIIPFKSKLFGNCIPYLQTYNECYPISSANAKDSNVVIESILDSLSPQRKISYNASSNHHPHLLPNFKIIETRKVLSLQTDGIMNKNGGILNHTGELSNGSNEIQKEEPVMSITIEPINDEKDIQEIQLLSCQVRSLIFNIPQPIQLCLVNKLVDRQESPSPLIPSIEDSYGLPSQYSWITFYPQNTIFSYKDTFKSPNNNFIELEPIAPSKFDNIYQFASGASSYKQELLLETPPVIRRSKKKLPIFSLVSNLTSNKTWSIFVSKFKFAEILAFEKRIKKVLLNNEDEELDNEDKDNSFESLIERNLTTCIILKTVYESKQFIQIVKTHPSAYTFQVELLNTMSYHINTHYRMSYKLWSWIAELVGHSIQRNNRLKLDLMVRPFCGPHQMETNFPQLVDEKQPNNDNPYIDDHKKPPYTFKHNVYGGIDITLEFRVFFKD